MSKTDLLDRFKEVAKLDRKDESEFVIVNVGGRNSTSGQEDESPSEDKKSEADFIRFCIDRNRNNQVDGPILPKGTQFDFQSANLRYQFGDIVVSNTVLAVD